jgi:ATP-dependent helicase Lhr and Lhr-like helicase
MSGLDRLHPQLQQAIINQLGWRSLRPVQEQTINAVLDGVNAVVLAPTAGGKTEAAMFPLLSRMLTESLEPVSALYVCPIRALLNNQEERLRSYARMVGFDVFKWHGDVSDSKKSGFRKSPTHLLMTTPESLEVMLVSERTDAQALFKGLSAVIIDEVHAFAGDDRGAHLAALLERLGVLAGRDLQRIGLSATVGNPHVIAQWLQGSSKRSTQVLEPNLPRPHRGRGSGRGAETSAPARDLTINHCADLDTAARAMGHQARGKKSLIFVESRASAEKVAHSLEGSSVEVFIHHSSVSKEDRALAEAQFAQGQNTAIVATSTMELGIDVGDLDQVLQLDAPSSVASFLQRMGRTGRRANTRANCTFYTLTADALLQAVALVRLAQAGWVEDVHPPSRALHVLAHQVMALVLQENGLSRHRLSAWLEGAYPFSGLGEEDLQRLVQTMLERDILYEVDGRLTLGRAGEQRYGRKNFFELYAVFSAPASLKVVHGNEVVGFIQASFASLHDEGNSPLCFRLGGRAWEVGHLDFEKGVAHVKAARAGRVPSWLGHAGLLSTKLCQTMREVLTQPGEDESAWLTRPAALELESLRASYAPLFELGPTPLEELEAGVQWHTFAGGAVNRLLAAGLEAKTGTKWVAGNLSLKCGELTRLVAQEAIAALPGLDWRKLAVETARHLARGQVSKFQPCLPVEAEDHLVAEKLLDVDGVVAFLHAP